MRPRVFVTSTVLALSMVGGLARAASVGVPAATPSTPTTPPAAAPLEDTAAYQKVLQARLATLQNLSMEYVQETTYSPAADITKSLVVALPRGVSLGAPYQGKFGFNSTFSFLNGRARFEATRDAATAQRARDEKKDDQEGSPGSERRRIEVFTPGHDETFLELPRRLIGSIRPKGELQGRIASPDVALGLRLMGADTWLDAKALEAMTYKQDNSGLVEVSTRTQTATLNWYFDPKLANALVRITRVDDALAPAVSEEVTASDFKEVQGVMLPGKITAKALWIKPGVAPSVTRMDEFKISKYVLGDSANKEDRYRITWPEGTLGYEDLEKATPEGKLHLLWIAEKEGRTRILTAEEYMKLEREWNAPVPGGLP